MKRLDILNPLHKLKYLKTSLTIGCTISSGLLYSSLVEYSKMPFLDKAGKTFKIEYEYLSR